MALVFFISGLIAFLTLALVSTTWAAPNAQGTVPTPPNPTAQPTTTGGGNNGGGQNNGGDNNGGDNNGGSQDNGDDQNSDEPVSVPTAVAPAVPTPHSGAECMIAENGAQCTAENLIVVVSAGAAPAGSSLTIEGPLAQPPCPASPNAFIFLSRCYRYAWQSPNHEPLAKLDAPVQYCFVIGPEQLVLVGNKSDTILVGLADTGAAWTLVKPMFDAATRRVCATTNQKVEWSALFAPPTAPILLPTTGSARTRGGYSRSQIWTPK